MSNQRESIQNTTDQELSQSTSTTPKPPSRRGLGSKKKSAERYRGKMNSTVGLDFISSRNATFHLEHGYDPDEVFGPIAVDTPIIKPTQEVVITTHLAPTIAEETVHTLIRSCKVPSQDIEFDVATVQLAVSLQLFAKEFYAQKNTPFAAPDAENEALAQRVVENISQSIQPIAVYIDQIGKCEVNNQVFVPTERYIDGEYRSFCYQNLQHPLLFERERFAYIGEQARDAQGNLIGDFPNLIPVIRNGIAVQGMGGNVYIRVLNEANRPAYQQLAFEGDLPPFLPPEQAQYVFLRVAIALPPPDEIFARYIEFMGRVAKKVMPDKLPTLELKKGIGTVAQIVGFGQEVQQCTEVRCARLVPAVCLYIGGAFQFGRAPQPLFDPAVAMITSVVDIRQAIHKLVARLTARKSLPAR